MRKKLLQVSNLGRKSLTYGLPTKVIIVLKTGGEVNRVAPEKLSEEFSNILSTEILATQVEIQLTLHQSVEFKNEDYENLSLRCSRLEKVIGNVTANSYISFAFDLMRHCLTSAYHRFLACARMSSSIFLDCGVALQDRIRDFMEE